METKATTTQVQISILTARATVASDIDEFAKFASTKNFFGQYFLNSQFPKCELSWAKEMVAITPNVRRFVVENGQLPIGLSIAD